MKTLLYDLETMSKCWDCKRLYPRTTDYFYKNKSRPSGFTDDCKPCKRKSQKVRNDRIRQRKWDFIASRDNRCEQCGIQNNNPSFFDLDHIVPVRTTKEARSFTYTKTENYQILCPNCHRLKNIKEGFRGLYDS